MKELIVTVRVNSTIQDAAGIKDEIKKIMNDN